MAGWGNLDVKMWLLEIRLTSRSQAKAGDMALPSENVTRAKALREESTWWFGGNKEGQCGWNREGEMVS